MNRRYISFGLFAMDTLWLVLAIGISYVVRYKALQPPPARFYWVLGATAVVAWAVLFRIVRLDGFNAGWRLGILVGRVATATLLLIACVLTVAYLDRLYYSRLLLGYFTVLLFTGFTFIRLSIYGLLRSHFPRRLATRVVLVGNNRITREFAFKIFRRPELLYEVVGTLYPTGDNSENGAFASSYGKSLNSLEVIQLLREFRVNELIVLEYAPGTEMQSFIVQCRSAGIHVNMLPVGYELYTSKPRLAEIDGLPLIWLESPAKFPWAPALKRVMDLSFVLLLAAPALVIITVAGLYVMRKTGAALRRELRIGKDGRPFMMYRLNIDREPGAAASFGRLLRQLSISELPQLWNVLRGEMSIVGPRPESPDRVKHYSEWQRQRLKAIPGITGLAQVNGLREQHPSEDKTRFDLQYLLEWSPVLDCVLLLQTLGTLLQRCMRRRNWTDVIPVTVVHDGAERDSSRQNSMDEIAC